MMGHGEYHDLISIEEIEHAVRKFAQQSASCTALEVDYYLRGRLGFDAGERDTHGEEKVVGCSDAPITIPRGGFRDVVSGFRSENNLPRHSPSWCRISCSATTHEMPASEFWR